MDARKDRIGRSGGGSRTLPPLIHYKRMTKEQKELLKGNEWRKLLLSLGEKEIIPVSSVGEIKCIRSVASDLNTDDSIKDKYSINADRELMLVTIIKTTK